MDKCRRHESKEAQEQKVTIVPRHTDKGRPRAKEHTSNEYKGKGAQEQSSTRVPRAQLQKYTRENGHKGKMPQANEDTKAMGKRVKKQKSQSNVVQGLQGHNCKWAQGKGAQEKGPQGQGGTRVNGHKGKGSQRKGAQVQCYPFLTKHNN